MNDSEKDELLAGQAKELFDDSVERIDAATLSRLNQGRHEALAEPQKPSGIGQWVPATGVAAAVVAVIVMSGPSADDVDEPAVTAADFEMLLEEDGLEMFEDLEFFTLLDEVDSEANGNVG